MTLVEMTAKITALVETVGIFFTSADLPSCKR
ncbi:unannotated protein [freshwater metagenome]|uniref:Unannotated protein n=1 Tax=freshwater metagenome TaxID=449393 RepID=A0A6J6WZN3_9ZZZZ